MKYGEGKSAIVPLIGCFVSGKVLRDLVIIWDFLHYGRSVSMWGIWFLWLGWGDWGDIRYQLHIKVFIIIEMARKSGISSFIMAAARASAKASRQAEASRRREHVAYVRRARAEARDLARDEKENAKAEKIAYLEMRQEEASDLTDDATNLFIYLKEKIIIETLEVDDKIDFKSLLPKYEPPTFTLPESLKNSPPKPLEELYLYPVGKEPWIGKIFPFIKRDWEKKLKNAQNTFKAKLEQWNNDLNKYDLDVQGFKNEFNKTSEQYKKNYQSKCDEIEDFKTNFYNLDREAVISYIDIVLERSNYIIDWERECRIGYSPESREILVEFRLPDFEAIPKVLEFKYVKSRDEIEEKPRKRSDIESCYKYLIANIALRTIHEILESDQANAVELVSFNGYIKTIDPSTGNVVSPVVISVFTSKEEFSSINLGKVDPIKCIQGLSASLSSSPNELTAVKPIREFSMVDKRFVLEQDIASGLDNRKNLMDLNPFEFENLVSNLFSKMGLETKQTRSSKDGGVDAIAFDTRPILGGKIVIQAKRYKNVVGVSSVRDLYGTMLNEGAAKGILVTTSSYGPDAFEFGKDKPLELIDGGGLLYLLKQVGIDAKIILPK